jgi:hypothetical protein
MTGTEVLLFLSFYFAPHLTFITPTKWISLPNKDYWLDPEHRPQTRAMIAEAMYRFGVVMFLFLFYIGLLVLDANRSDPVAIDLTQFYVVFTVLMAYMIWWTIRFYMMFRKPKQVMQGGRER